MQEEYECIAAYSPYDNLPSAVQRSADDLLLPQQQHHHQQQRQVQGSGGGGAWLWPHLLVTASLHDPRVPFWGPARCVHAHWPFCGRKGTLHI